MNVKEESEKVGVKLNVQKTKIMASGPFMANRWGNNGNSDRLYLGGGSKSTADGDCSHEIKRHLLLGRKAMTNLLLLLLSFFSRVQLCVTPETAAHQAPRPWDSPGKSTGVGCHCLLRQYKKQRHHFTKKGSYSQSSGFSISQVRV